MSLHCRNCRNRPHEGWLVPSAAGAVPIASRLSCYLNTLEVEPLDGTQVVVAGDHPSPALALAAGAICGLRNGRMVSYIHYPVVRGMRLDARMQKAHVILQIIL